MTRAAAVVIALALLVQARGPAELVHARGCGIAIVAMACAAASLLAGRVARCALALASGVLSIAVLPMNAPLACATGLFGVLVHVMHALMDQGKRRDAMIAAAFATVGLVGLRGAGELGVASAVFIALKALFVVLLLVPNTRQTRIVAPLLLSCAMGFVVRRLVYVLSSATNDGAVFWAEEPFLVDMLKLDAHESLYGPIEDLSSYTYSPLMQLAHHAILTPLHRELSLGTNRLLTIADQLVATVLFAWSIAPRVRAGLARLFPLRPDMFVLALAAVVGFSNLLAGALHPDHPTLACVALAFALVAREGSFPRWLWWTLLIVVTPLAVMFKLTGGGIGLGLAAVFIAEKRFKPIAALAVSGFLSVATIPLFDATCGAFRSYAIELQRSHPLEWSRLLEPPTLQFAAAAALALAIAFAILRSDAAEDDRRLMRRAVIFFGFVAFAFFPAYVKYAGRENNLVVVLVASVILLVVAGAASQRPLLAATAALYVVALAWPAPRAPSPPSPLGLDEQLDAAEAAMRDDDAHHAPTWASATLHIRHGERQPPKDCINIAYELFYGKRPEAELFFRDIGDGRYRSVIMVSADLQADETLRGRFARRLTDALSRNYELVYPTIPVAANVNHIIVFRRKE
ncbi:MAG TPA: hypothetical protein VGH87_17465 [Polyangiaceae bacterium]